MKVFLAWSGPISHDVATALHNWIPLVVQCARPFISTGDIEKGRRWNDVLGEELNQSDYGIVCVTRDNYMSRWLHFEAGAISKAIDNSFVSPVLFHIEPTELKGPLTQFQYTVCSKEDLLNLMRSINSRLGDEHRLSENLLVAEFERWWPDLNKALNEIATKHSDVTHTVYPWLYTTEDLTRVSCTKARSCIWWITPNPFQYVLTPTIKQSIRECIMRDVTFTVLIPTSERSDEAKPVIKHIAPEKPDKTRIVEIPSKEFHPAAVTDYVILDPEEDSKEVFLELPVEQRGYWINVINSESAEGFATRFQNLAKKQGKHLGSSDTNSGPSAATKTPKKLKQP